MRPHTTRSKTRSSLTLRLLLTALMSAVGACSGSAQEEDFDTALQEKIQNVVVIYAENRSFDNVYGTFPGANGIPGVNASAKGTLSVQTDRDASNATLSKLPLTWGGLTAAGQSPSVTQAQTDNLANSPFLIDTQYNLGLGVITRDLYHRFFENQMQINGGKNDKFAAWADAGGLTMGYYDGSKMALWNVAKNNVLADNFFQAAFGGSFLNHQYLVCACAPDYAIADPAPATPTVSIVDSDGGTGFTHNLSIDTAHSAASSLDGPPIYKLSGNIAPKNYFGDGTFRAINTMQPPYQPSFNAPTSTDATHLFADSMKATTLPPQTQATIADKLDERGVTWAWYAGAWDDTLAISTGNRVYPTSTPGAAPNFQFHHQPFNYYAKFDPQTGAAARTAHLKDGSKLLADASAGTLPQVVFYKPEGDLNQHAGYASVSAGDQHLADVVSALQASKQYAGMVIVITYDENGGWWDHVAPPKGDLLGPGSRIPAIIISPFAKKGTIDHTQYDTASIQRFLNRRFGLSPLAGITARDNALKANGAAAMGDLTAALQF
ncbi:MAG: acid phosphatase [Deltaproteobacteria bacterium]|nr:acid phosphatase [Deltaproteobacteria bacterium]